MFCKNTICKYFPNNVRTTFLLFPMSTSATGISFSGSFIRYNSSYIHHHHSPALVTKFANATIYVVCFTCILHSKNKARYLKKNYICSCFPAASTKLFGLILHSGDLPSLAGFYKIFLRKSNISLLCAEIRFM